MEFQEIVQTCRNVREFSNEPIPQDVMLRILEAARMASSAFNYQPWRFVVVQDRGTLAQLAQHTKGQLFVATAAAVVVCCGKMYQNRYTWLSDDLYLVDVAIATDHLQLAARNEGVGSCWIAVFEPDPIKTLLEIPEDHELVMLVPMGYPTTPALFHPTTDRLPLEQIAFFEKFGPRETDEPADTPSRRETANV